MKIKEILKQREEYIKLRYQKLYGANEYEEYLKRDKQALRKQCVILSSRCVPRIFSSRRRHTRYRGDWSSDVCSSDLQKLYGANEYEEYLKRDKQALRKRSRSEECHVGKECRSRWSPYH